MSIDWDLIGVSSPGKSKPKKNSRRSFTRTQKNEILAQQDNKCAICHKPLDPRATHFHHIKPWSSGGRTITVNGAALCPNCHAIITHKERLRKVNRKKKKKKAKPKTLSDLILGKGTLRL